MTKNRMLALSLIPLSLAGVSTQALAVADPMITAGITAAGTSFTNNFGEIFPWFVGIVMVIAASTMLVKYIRRAH